MAQDWFSQFEKPKAAPVKPPVQDDEDWFGQFSNEPAKPAPVASSNPGLFDQLYNAIFNAPKAITEPAHRFAESIDQPSLEEPTILPDWLPFIGGEPVTGKGFLAGATEGAASQLSPANILTLGRGKLPQIAARIAGGMQAGHGAEEIYHGNTWEGLGDIGMGALMGLGGSHVDAPPTSSILDDAGRIVIPDVLPGIPKNPEVDNILRNSPFGEGSVIPSGVTPSELRPLSDDIRYPAVNIREDVIPLSVGDRPDLVPVGAENIYNAVRKPAPPGGITDDAIYGLAQEKFNMGKSNEFDPSTLKFESKGDAPSIFKDVDKLADSPTRRKLSLGTEGDMPTVDLFEGVKSDKLRGKVTDVVDMPRATANETPRAVGGKNTPVDLSPTSPGGKPPRKPPEVELAANNEAGKFANESQKKSLWANIRDTNRSILTAFDFSAAGRQGKPLMMTKAYWNSFDDMFKSWGSQRAYDNVMESITQHPNFIAAETKGAKSLAQRAKLDIGGKEEAFNSSIAEKLVPGVKRSERAYSAFLNKLRADHFNTMIDDARKMGLNPDANDVVLQQIGSFINDATGRGSLGKLQASAPALNEIFFAPKLMASRVNMYKRWLNPMTYSNQNPVVRQQALKSLLSTVGFGVAAGELARLAGASVSNDPNSSDFRKIKIGDNTRIDPFSGFQQYAVGASRLLSGELTSSKTNRHYDLTRPKFGMPSRASVASQFMQNKLAPIPSLVWSWMEGKDWDGQPFDAKKAVLDRTVPIVMQDLAALYQEDPKILGGVSPMVLGILPMMGEGIQTYGR